MTRSSPSTPGRSPSGSPGRAWAVAFAPCEFAGSSLAPSSSSLPRGAAFAAETLAGVRRDAVVRRRRVGGPAVDRSGALRRRRRRGGFTLLELLVVVAIVAVVAGGVVLALGGEVEERARGDLVLHELTQLRRAVLRFQRDTGHLPRRGPFALTSDPTPGAVVLGADPDAAEWFASPANMAQLLENPLRPPQEFAGMLAAPSPADLPLGVWNPDARRGWRGPYLHREGSRSVPAGDDLTGPPVPEVPVVLDPWGNPFLLFLDAATPDDLRLARLVSLGPDGALGSGDDIEVRLQ
ncbi:MAG: prepilin-type N-terminal cleavage/methylation domain-containing protein [Planctomycetota bacterium]|nr:MAG: prepilin-type N-terminal cleavage/methylation domain-containing protein [Planctomycetota bacterium]